jgi:hypothetical protein
MTNQGTVSAETILAYLAHNPDLGGLLTEYPQVTSGHARACFAYAQAVVHEAPTVMFRKGATRTVIMRTHGLPAPDPSLHKGNIFKGDVLMEEAHAVLTRRSGGRTSRSPI